MALRAMAGRSVLPAAQSLWSPLLSEPELLPVPEPELLPEPEPEQVLRAAVPGRAMRERVAVLESETPALAPEIRAGPAAAVRCGSALLPEPAVQARVRRAPGLVRDR